MCNAAGPSGRTVGSRLRPAPDTMSVLSGYLPAEQGVACLKSLRDQTDALKAAGDPRCRDQIMADTLVERLTGQADAADVNAELQIVMPLDALLDANNQTPAELNGYGPLPADLARDLMRDQQGQVVVAAALRRTGRRAAGRWRSASPPLRRPPQKVDHVAGSAMPGPVL